MSEDTKQLKFLVDESSGKKLFIFLLDKGFDVKFVTEIMPQASDKDVLQFAEKEDRVLITNDKDFGELIFRLGRPSSGIVFLRLKKDSPQNRQKYVDNIIGHYGSQLRNNFIVVTDNQVRVRKAK